MNRRETRSPQNLLLKKRLEIVFIAMMLAFCALALRLVWIQGIQQQYFTAKADQMRRREIPSPARRGVIRDRTGWELVTNLAASDICANPRAIADKPGVAAKLARLIGGSEQRYLEKLTRAAAARSFFVYLARGLDRQKGLAVQAARLEGIEVRPATKRVHPAGPLAAHILGYVDIDNRGLEGAEARFDQHLRGRDGYIVAEVDATQKVIPDTEREVVPPVDGRDVTLTIDASIQEFAEAELARVAATYKPEGATAIVMDVRTGEILAMANVPTYDPNVRGAVPPANRRNRAITDLYEPGSTFKTITAIVALEEGIPTSAYCSGSMGVGRRSIHCAHGSAHGRVDLKKFIQKSCNVTAGTLAQRLGSRKLYHHIQQLGFLEKTGIELIGETNGWLQKPETWATMKTTNVGFGQGVVTTPLQLLRAYAAVANGGLLVKPTILKAIDGVTLPPPPAPRRVMRESTAARVREALEAVCELEGTGTAARIANYTAAGKTGTAQLARGGIYVPGAYVSSFVGFLPATRPRIAILVSVTRPHGPYYGGVVAAPAFREIARQTMAYLEVPPDSPGDIRDGARVGSFLAWERHRTGRTRSAVASAAE